MARPPSAASILRNERKQERQFEPKTPIATGMFLPNHSGIKNHPEFIKAIGDYVPYTGATSNVDLNSKNLTTTGTLGAGAITGTGLTLTGFSGFLKATTGVIGTFTIASTDITDWGTYIDQAVKTTSSPSFVGVNLQTLQFLGASRIDGQAGSDAEDYNVNGNGATDITMQMPNGGNAYGGDADGGSAGSFIWREGTPGRGSGYGSDGGKSIYKWSYGAGNEMYIGNSYGYPTLMWDSLGVGKRGIELGSGEIQAGRIATNSIYSLNLNIGHEDFNNPSLTLTGDPNNGIITWIIASDYFKFSDDILMNSTEAIYFRDTAIHIASLNDGHLDLTADTSIDLNAPVILKAGTATAGTAPLKFTSGTSLTTAEAGAIEFTTDDFFATITTGTARKALVLDNGTRLTSGKIPVATTNGRLIDGVTPLSGTKVYYVSDTSGGAVTRKLTFINGILTSET